MPLTTELVMHLAGQRLRKLYLTNEVVFHGDLSKSRTIFLRERFAQVIGHGLIASIELGMVQFDRGFPANETPLD